MYYLIYKITNTLNGKFYIGAHKTLDINDGYLGSGVLIQRAIRKYGIKNFSKEIIFTASSSEEMYQKEKDLVILTRESYNIKLGGHGGWDHIPRERSTELRRKISQTLRGKKLSINQRKNQSIGKQGNTNAAKKWKVMDPSGEILIVISLFKYCKDNNINMSNMTKLSPKGTYYCNRGHRLLEKLDG